jgi:hypothetical protein
VTTVFVVLSTNAPVEYGRGILRVFDDEADARRFAVEEHQRDQPHDFVEDFTGIGFRCTECAMVIQRWTTSEYRANGLWGAR